MFIHEGTVVPGWESLTALLQAPRRGERPWSRGSEDELSDSGAGLKISPRLDKMRAFSSLSPNPKRNVPTSQQVKEKGNGRPPA